ncbi:MAG TPA: hypothetical protein DDW29_02215 [Gammaproteobacteria bacterium]|nr:hypothetical protein [Gammaproteobacteria bacterium]
MNRRLSLTRCFNSGFILIGLLFAGTSMADLGVEDPTRPVYMSKQIKTTGKPGEAEIDKEKRASIPVLTQLIYAPSRKIAVFGDTFLNIGESAEFGEVIDIQKDRVLVKPLEGEIKEIIFYEQFDQELEGSNNEDATTLSEKTKKIDNSNGTIYIR